MLDQPIDNSLDKGIESSLHVMSVQEKIRLGIFLQSIGIDIAKFFICINNLTCIQVYR